METFRAASALLSELWCRRRGGKWKVTDTTVGDPCDVESAAPGGEPTEQVAAERHSQRTRAFQHPRCSVLDPHGRQDLFGVGVDLVDHLVGAAERHSDAVCLSLHERAAHPVAGAAPGQAITGDAEDRYVLGELEVPDLLIT